MKIKRFVAADMRQAIKRVREEQGPDAVILANRKVAEGVEIIAALDYDEEALYRQSEGATGEDREPRGAAPQQARRAKAPAAAPAAAASQDRPRAADAPKRDDSFANMARHYAELDEADDFDDDFAASALDPADLEALAEDDFEGYPPRSGRDPARSPAHYRAGDAMADGMPDLADARARGRQMAGDADQQLRSDADGAHSLRRRAALQRDEFDELGADYPRGPAGSALLRDEPEALAGRAGDRALGDMQRELQALRGLMENQLSVLEWNNLSRRQPLRVALLSRFEQMGVGSDIAESIVGQIVEGEDVERAWRQALQLLVRRVPVADDDFLNEGGVIAVVGPTGVGKTTTVAKLAARFAMRHGPRNLALVTSDTYRIGAQEQLLHYARILGVPLKTANDGDELAKILAAYLDKQLVLIDTAGMSQRDLRLTEQFKTLRSSSALVKPYLVLSANAQLSALDETVRAFNRVELAGAIVTKLDEAASIGGALTVACRHRLPIACVGTGQRVPEDLQGARAAQLVERALPESGWDAARSAPEVMAVKFGGGGQHAHG